MCLSWQHLLLQHAGASHWVHLTTSLGTHCRRSAGRPATAAVFFPHPPPPSPPQNERGISALGVAVGFNRVPFVELLLDAGADLALRDGQGNTVLHYAAGARHDAARAHNCADYHDHALGGRLQVPAQLHMLQATQPGTCTAMFSPSNPPAGAWRLFFN